MNFKHGLSRTAAYKTEQARRWRAAHPEDKIRANAYTRAWRKEKIAAGLCGQCGIGALKTIHMCEACLIKKLARNKRPDVAAQRRLYRSTEKQVVYDRKYQKLDQLRIKKLVFESYGGCACRCCGESVLEFLSIDHITGWRHMPVAPRGGTGLYRWLRRNNFPGGFQVLCFNCNFAKGHFGACPHQMEGKK